MINQKFKLLAAIILCFYSSMAKAADLQPAFVIPFSGTSIADIAESAAPAVVNIEMSRRIPLNRFPFSGLPAGNLEFFFNGKKITPEQLGGVQNGSGAPEAYQEKHDTASGFIVRADGYIVTNAHAVKDQTNIKVTLNDGRAFDSKVVGVDYFSDLAVLKVDAKSLPTLQMGSSKGLRPGEFAIAIGSPLGYDHTVTLGIISAVGRTVTDVNGNINFIQTDAAINPGNSGGPLLSLKGEVVGVNTAIRRDAQNIGFSIPIDIAKSVVDELIAKGKISRPWLGIVMKELDDVTIKGLGIPADTKGVMISGFVQGSPGQAAGLKVNDVITKIEGKDVDTPKMIKELVQARKVGEALNFLVLRDHVSQAVAVNIGTYPETVNPRLRSPLR